LSLKNILEGMTIADKILLSALILLSFSGIFYVKDILPKGRTVQIESGGRLVYLLPLDKDKTVSVDGLIGKTIIEIKDRKVRIIESPCRNKLCVKEGWVESGAILCLPNKVVVTIGNYKDYQEGIKPDPDAVDAITG
jgi:hypothetical protein